MKDESKDLLDKTTDWILAEQENYKNIRTELSQWKKTFPNQTPQQVKELLEKYKVESVEKLLVSRSRQNNFKSISKKEHKICEICSQPRYDDFKYSRISNRGFNVNRIYLICSFCQKTVQTVADS